MLAKERDHMAEPSDTIITITITITITTITITITITITTTITITIINTIILQISHQL